MGGMTDQWQSLHEVVTVINRRWNMVSLLFTLVWVTNAKMSDLKVLNGYVVRRIYLVRSDQKSKSNSSRLWRIWPNIGLVDGCLAVAQLGVPPATLVPEGRPPEVHHKYDIRVFILCWASAGLSNAPSFHTHDNNQLSLK
jgi:hypothetical protein